MTAVPKKTTDDVSRSQLIPLLCNPETVIAFLSIAILLSILFEVLRVPLLEFDLIHMLFYFLSIAGTLCLAGAILCSMRELANRWHTGLVGVLALAIVIVSAAFVNLLFFDALRKAGEPALLFILRASIISAILGLIILGYLHLQESIRIHRELEFQGRLKMLQARIQPHFLFNSLNSISSLVMFDANKAEQAIMDLSDLFRSTLKEDARATIESEMKIVNSFIRMEKLRLGERLNVEWQVDSDLLQQDIIHLSIQPLVENAIIHGIHKIPEGGTVGISIQREGRQIVVTVTNPLVGGKEKEGASAGTRMALNNIRSRLDVLFSSEAELVTRAENGRFTALFRYPIAGRDE